MRVRLVGLFPAALAVTIVAASVGRAETSFDCRYAKLPDEILICHDQKLLQLDELMANIYAKVRRSADENFCACAIGS